MADVVSVVDKGLELIVDRLISAGTEKYLAWGVGTTSALPTNTGMETESTETSTTRVTGTQTKVTTSTTGDTLQVVGTIVCAGSAKAITEIGIFNQPTASGSVMFLHGTFSPINVNVGDSIEFTIKCQFQQG